MEKASWLHHAQKLERGQRARVSHDCADDRSMIVSAGDKGWSAHCFRCGDGFVPYPQESLSDRLARLRKQVAYERVAASSIKVPRGTSNLSEWPLSAKVWLYSAGLSNDDIYLLGATWNDRMQRVVLPVRDRGELVFWQARNTGPVTPSRPKYLAPAVDRSRLVATYGSYRTKVLVEDILSAYKVASRTGYEAWAIMGTSISDHCLARMATEKADHYYLWFDPDKGGDKAFADISPKLAMLGAKVTHVRSDVDPKKLSRQEILCHLT